jgi:hypothetical protein
MHLAEIVRLSVLGAWAVVLAGSVVLRWNASKLSPAVLRYLAYLGYTDPRDLLNSPASNPTPVAASAKGTAS